MNIDDNNNLKKAINDAIISTLVISPEQKNKTEKYAIDKLSKLINDVGICYNEFEYKHYLHYGSFLILKSDYTYLGYPEETNLKELYQYFINNILYKNYPK